MPKYILTEGVVEKLINFVFKMVADGKTAALKKRFEKDPIMIKYIEETDLHAHKIGEYLKSMEARGNDPKFRDL